MSHPLPRKGLLGMSNLSRAYTADIEIRSDGTGRTVHGLVVPYGQVARVSDGGPAYQEMFAPGAFSRDIVARAGNFSAVKLLFQHDANNAIGRAVSLREDANGLYGEFQVTPEAARGNEALALLRDGVLDSFSVGFRPVAHEKRDGVTVRTKAAIREASLVTFPAYEGALVAGVRSLPTELQGPAITLLAQIAAADAAFDPFVEAFCAADCALDDMQSFLALLLGVEDPDMEDAGEGDLGDVGMGDGMNNPATGDMTLEMASKLTTFGRRLADAVATRTSDSTADVRSETASTTDPDPASATPLGAHPSFKSSRLRAREIGAI